MKLGGFPSNQFPEIGFSSYLSDSSFSPSDISGLKLWLKADAITGLSDGDLLSTWEDQSGQNNDATAAGDLRPTYQTSEINGLPIVRFDHSNDYMTTPSITMSSQTIFLVLIGTAANCYVMSFNNGDNENGVIYGFVSNTIEIYNNPRVQGGTANAYGVFTIIRESGVGTETRKNGSTVNTSGSVWTTNTGFVGIGATAVGGTFGGDIAEIIVYNSALSGGDLTNVETYLADKYGL